MLQYKYQEVINRRYEIYLALEGIELKNKKVKIQK